MKKNLFNAVLLLGLAIVSGCSDDNTLVQSVEKVTTVEAVIENTTSRTTVGADYKVSWNAEDSYTVWSGDNIKGDMKLEGEGGETTGLFTFDEGSDAELTNGDIAIFPASSAKDYTFPSEYTSTETDAPMYGTYDGTKFTFKHLAAMIRVTASNLPAGEAVLTISSDKTLTGTAELNGEALTVPTSGEKQITVTFEIPAQSETFIFDAPIPVQNYDNGLKLTLKVGNTKIFDKTTSAIDAEAGNLYYLNNDYVGLATVMANGGTYTLNRDLDLTGGDPFVVPAGKEVTIDLNGYELSYSDDVQGTAMITNNGTLTIKDTSAEKNGKLVYTYEGEPDTSNGIGNYTINNTGKLIVEANINAVAGEEGKKFSHAFYAIHTSGETIIKSGKILNKTNFAIRQWVDSETKSSDITVEGGEIEGLRAIWIQLPGRDKTKAPLGNLTIKSGKLTGTAIDGTADDGYVNAICSHSYGSQMKKTQINIEGGDFYGDLQLTCGRSGAKVDVEKVTITGGTFHGHNGERVFGVVSWAADDLTSEAITITGGTFYHPYPLNYMEGDNGTIDIKLARDLEYTDTDGKEDNKPIVVPVSNTVILDLNGKTLSRKKAQTDTYAMITNKGTLTIKDTSAEKNGKISYADITEYTAAIGYASNTIRNEGTLTLVSGTIENISDENVRNNGYPHAIDVYPGSTTNIEGGTVKSANYDCIRMFCNSETLATTVKISEGKIINRVTFQNPNNSTNTPGYGILNISGGTFTTTTDYVTANVRLLNFSNDVSMMKAEITGGTFDRGVKTQDLSSSWEENWDWLTIGDGVEIDYVTQ